MAAVTRNDLNSGVLQTYLNRQVLAQLEPELYFYKLGRKPAMSGYNTIGWAKFDSIAASAVTAGTTSNDGVTPSDTDFDATVVTASALQYRIVVNISDLVKELNVIDFVTGAAVSVGNALARKIDEVIQTEVMAGTNVLYGGSATARTGLGASDKITAALFNKARAYLDGKNANKMDGGFVAFIHPFVAYDLRAETGTGNWLEVNKYVTNEKILKGEIGMLNGIRVVIAPNVKTFASTVTVYPTLVVGDGAYGVADFQAMRTYIVPATPSDSDPLAQRTKVGAKVTFAAKRLQEDCMVRIETAATLVF
jgi:N4-gp56 family major capsid protein